VDSNVKSLKLETIKYNENSRINYHDGRMSELMASMKANGLLQPIGVAAIEKDQYHIIFGHRRFLAAKKLGWESIDAIIFEDKDAASLLIKNLTENISRSDVNFYEQGKLFSQLKSMGLDVYQIATRVGVSATSVRQNIEAYTHLPQVFRKEIKTTSGRQFREGKIPKGNVVAILGLKKAGKISAAQTDDFLKWSKQEGVTPKHVRVAANLVDRGFSTAEAIKRVDGLKPITLTFLVDEKNVSKVEKKYNAKLSEIIYSWVEQHADLKIYAGASSHEKKVMIHRRKRRSEA